MLGWISDRFRRSPAAAASHDAPTIAPRSDLSDTLLRLGWIDPEQWAHALAGPMQREGLTTPQRQAAFLANVGHETNGGRRLVESLDYTPDRLGQVFGARATGDALSCCRHNGCAADQRGIANAVYGGDWGRRNLGNTNPGDGWAFIGRGLIQITGRANYERVAKVVGTTPEALGRAMETREGAADTACRWWAAAGCNTLADAGDLAALRRRVNGGAVGLAQVRERYAAAIAALS